VDNPIYQKFKEASNKQLASLKPSDVVLFESDEIPENYTLVAPATEEIVQVIKTIFLCCPNYIQGQYLYPDTEIHLTMIGNMSTSIDPELIMNAVKKAIQESKLLFRMFGVASNMHAVSISCYPQDFDMNSFREQVRSDIKDTSDDYTIHLQEYEYMGWLNFMRYLRQPTAPELDELKLLMNEEFGIFKPTRLQIYKNRSHTLNEKKRELVGEIILH